MFVTHRCVNFGMEKVEIPADGVITGFGQVNGRPVFAYSQDFTSRAGSLGEMHAKKICKVMDLALKAGVPFVGFNDSGGARIQEGVDSLSALRPDLLPQRHRLGVIPQISAIMGPTAGGAVYSPAMTDFIFMVKNTSYMFITGPGRHQERHRRADQLGGAGRRHGPQRQKRRGPVRLRERRGLPRTDQEACCLSSPATTWRTRRSAPVPIRPAGRSRPWTPSSPTIPGPPTTCTTSSGPSSTTGIFRAPGPLLRPEHHHRLCPAGRPARGHHRQPAQGLAGCLDVDAADKACRFIRFCDAFNLPLLTIADVPGYLPGQRPGVAGHHPPRRQAPVVLLRGHGAQAHPDHPQGLRRQLPGHVLPGPGRGPGACLAHRRDRGHGGGGARPTSSSARRSRRPRTPWPSARRSSTNYENLLYNPYIAASRGFVDQVIAPRETRPRLIAALEVLASKRETLPPKKHGNIPV